MELPQRRTSTRWLSRLFFMPESWLLIVLLTTISANWWHSIYLMIPFIFASVFAWITHDAAYPADDLY